MGATLNHSMIKDLSPELQAKVAQELLQQKRIQVVPSKLTLSKTDTPENWAVEFFRVSSTQQRDGYSLSAQKDMAFDYKDKHELQSQNSWSVSESASKEFDRKKFFEMLNFVTSRGIKNIIFDKVDRACRGLRAAVMIEDLIDSGVRFHFVRDNLIVDKNSSPSEKLRFYLGVILAKHYIDNLKVEINKGLNKRTQEGHYNSKAPIGYKNVRSPLGKANMEIDKSVSSFITDCFELYKTGNYSRKDLEKIGVERGIKLYRNKRVTDEHGVVKIEQVESLITEKTLEKILTNPTYCQSRWEGKKIISVQNCKWEAITSVETFKACQKIKGIRAKQSQKSNKKSAIHKPFMQMMTCGVCDHKVTGEVKRKSSGKTYIYYHCANRKCEQRRINTEQQKIITQLRTAFLPFEKFTPKATTAFIKTLKDSLSSLDVSSSREVQMLREQEIELKKRINELEKLAKKGLLTPEEEKTLLATKESELNNRQIELEAHLKADQQVLESSLKVIELLEKASKFMQLDGYELEKAELAKSMLSNLVLKNGTIEYHYGKPFDDLVELVKGRNWWRWRESNSRPKRRLVSGLRA